MKRLELFWPLKRPFISQGFGENLVPLYKDIGMAGHNGLDLPCPVGEPVYASHDGIVSYAGVDSSEGYGVVIRTKEQFLDIDNKPHFWKTIYWHLLPRIPVSVGKEVMAGDIIGYGDTTGKATGSHLHYGLKPIAQGENEWSWTNINQNNGYFGAVDPQPYMSVMTAYTLRSSLQVIAETLKKISEILANFIKGRNK